MISRIRGTLIERSGETIEIETASGVVYEIEVPTTVLQRIPALGSELSIRTLHVVREESASLYGFLEPYERALFKRLLLAKGVGAKTALAMMSTYTAERLARALAERDIAALSRVSGIGKKTAERIVIDLADRVKDLVGAAAGGEGATGGPAQGAIAALIALGYDFAAADAAVRDALAEGEPESTDALIRRALAGR
ncbi:MAG: Holliday junction branch migration protein RuvA [Longimicrobiales bacterium]|nr:Holliday junction branch migration protein RuvA [Longimicrobiales bacterium]